HGRGTRPDRAEPRPARRGDHGPSRALPLRRGRRLVHGRLADPAGGLRRRPFVSDGAVRPRRPARVYGPAFNLQFQVFASRGYAVVYTNPRGSQTYGQDFALAVVGDWGGKDYH